MKTRAIALLSLTALLLPLILIGPEQYGYAFIGLLAGLGAAAKSGGAESPLWMIILPIFTIIIMIIFAGLALISIACLAVRVARRPQSILQNKVAELAPAVFAAVVIFGLLLLKMFPGDPWIHVSSALFVSPILVLLSTTFTASKV